jgi:uncharacterized repeat protein (TIGR02543 family)
MKNAKKNARALAIAAALACAVLALAGCSDSGPANFTVAFDSQGGGAVPSADVMKGDAAAEPVDLENGDLVFGGWYTEAACSTRWDFRDPVAKDRTLYAKWNAANTLSFAPISGGAAWEVSKGSGKLDSDLYIPAYYKGIPVTRVASNGFKDCIELVKVSLARGITDLGEASFQNCGSMTHIEIPAGIVAIEKDAFSNCINLKDLVLPQGLESIGSDAFWSCKALTSMLIPASVSGIGEQAFAICSSLPGFAVDSANENFRAIDGVLFNKDGTVLLSFPGGRPADSYTVPNGIKQISIGAFGYCYSLKNIYLPEGLTDLGDSAFVSCYSLQSIALPSSLVSIGNNCFSFCSELPSIVIPIGATYVGIGAFYVCGALSIRCEAPKQPSSWNLYWNPDSRPVTWGYKH